MNEDCPLNIVAGAPGAGKSTVVQACLAAGTTFVAFDMDWLIGTASKLAKDDIHFNPALWPLYNGLWLDVIHATCRNGLTPVLFAPLAPSDLPALPAWCPRVNWFLLDCPDDILTARLTARAWAHSRIAQALKDAADLRSVLCAPIIDTAQTEPPEIVASLEQWIRS